MQEQTGLLTIVKGFSDEIQVEVGLDKCSKATFKKGKLTTTENIHVDLNTSIQTLEQESTYKLIFLGTLFYLCKHYGDFDSIFCL